MNMKLSTRDIAIIEDLLTLREEGKTGAEVAKTYGIKGNSGPQLILNTLAGLKSIGVNVPAAPSVSETRKREWAEFQAWRSAQRKAAESTLIPAAARPDTLFRPNGNAASYTDAVRVTGL